MMWGSFSGQPVAKAVTKSADVDRLVIILSLCGLWNEGRDFDFDLRPHVDQAVDIEQCRGREVSRERLLPCGANSGAGGLIFAPAGEIPVQADDVLWACARFRQKLHDPPQRASDLSRQIGRIVALRVAAGLACQHDPSAWAIKFHTM